MLKSLLASIFMFGSYGVDNPSFETDIKPIFSQHCVECHKGITNYKIAASYKDKIYNKIVLKQQMPPNYRNKLSEYETELIKKWVNNGARK